MTKRPAPRERARAALALLLACLGALAVGVIDVASGAEVHVVSLYFIPLVWAGWRLPRPLAVVVALLSTGVWMVALYLDGSRFSHAYVWVANFLTQGCAFLTVVLLVCQLRRQLLAEQARSRTDLLTGLLNRTGFTERAAQLLPLCRRHARPVCVVYLDLDNFKGANDRLGHDHGDLLLRLCGTLIGRCIRASDLAARMGGDEFVLLLPETDLASTLEVCRRVLALLEATPAFRAAGVSASLGVVVDEQALLEVDELLRRADAEMYRVKRRGHGEAAGGLLAPRLSVTRVAAAHGAPGP